MRSIARTETGESVASDGAATAQVEERAAAGQDGRPGSKATGAKGRRVQVRSERANGWTKAKRAVFLDHLAATCNVVISANAAGIAPPNAYALKRRDAEFAALWAAALEAGYEHIETQLLARAIGSNPHGLGESPAGDDPAAASAGGVFDPALAIRVLAQREGRRPGHTRGPVGKRVPIEQVRAILMTRLAALNARLKRERDRAPRLPAPGASVPALPETGDAPALPPPPSGETAA